MINRHSNNLHSSNNKLNLKQLAIKVNSNLFLTQQRAKELPRFSPINKNKKKWKRTLKKVIKVGIAIKEGLRVPKNLKPQPQILKQSISEDRLWRRILLINLIE